MKIHGGTGPLCPPMPTSMLLVKQDAFLFKHLGWNAPRKIKLIQYNTHFDAKITKINHHCILFKIYSTFRSMHGTVKEKSAVV